MTSHSPGLLTSALSSPIASRHWRAFAKLMIERSKHARCIPRNGYLTCNQSRNVISGMNSITNLSAQELSRAAVIKDQIDTLHVELNDLIGVSNGEPVLRKTRVMSAGARRKIAAAQKARWAKARDGKAGKLGQKPKRKMSAAGRARIAAAAKARWAKAKAAGRKTL